ncbi:MAG: dephospho-CoA kinase [bacterium]
MRVIGLTGPMGAGKNEVAKLLERRGFFIIDADKVAHTLYYPQTPVWKELLKAFGSGILIRGGEINRKKLGEIVFADEEKLAELNRIVHPYLKDEIKALLEEQTGKTVINAALPQLFEGLIGEVWVVVASEENRLERLIKTGLKKDDAKQRMGMQMEQEEYEKFATAVIINDGTKRDLDVQVQTRI